MERTYLIEVPYQSSRWQCRRVSAAARLCCCSTWPPFSEPFDGFQLVLPPTLDDDHHRHIRLWFFLLSVRAFATLEQDNNVISSGFIVGHVFNGHSRSRTDGVSSDDAAALATHRMAIIKRDCLLQYPAKFAECCLLF